MGRLEHQVDVTEAAPAANLYGQVATDLQRLIERGFIEARPQSGSFVRPRYLSAPAEPSVTRPAGGFVLWVELPEGADSLKLYEQAQREGMTIAPGPIFSAKRRYRSFIRLNCASWSEEIQSAVARLGRLAAGLKRRGLYEVKGSKP